jgi:cellulose synthase/poly-beta-1,6-N-acetylglucosamine synthase-like glycosyltransferase
MAFNLFEIAIYPFLFAAIYFQAFLLVTFLSKPARLMRARTPSHKTPSVAIIVPCWNEEATVAGTADSLLALDYPADKLRVVLVDDGSTDGTKVAMSAYATHPQVTVIYKENGGKHTAINAGIEAAKDAEFIGCLDADSFVASDALREAISCFEDPNVAAVTPAMSVFAPKTMLEHMQNAEFLLGIALRHIIAAVNGLYVTPGPFSLYRRDVVVALGGFRYGHQAEDMEMALRIQKAGYAIDNAPRARVYTKGMKTVPTLVKQRTRWTSGFLRNMLTDYRSLVGNPRYGALGLIVLPLGFLAIVGGLITFVIVIYQFVKTAIDTYLIVSGVPFSFTLASWLPPFGTIEWFYFPMTLFVMLTTIAAAGSIAFMVLGKHISKTPGDLALGVVGYLLLFGIVAPFWLLRSVADVASGTKRSWR